MSLPPAEVASTPGQSFQCHFPGCSLSYRRKEHLTRHAQTHFQKRSYKCPFCDRVCARNDTLRQHVRMHHKDKELQSSRSRAARACDYCRSRKSKCNGKNPCNSCFERRIQCSLAPDLNGSRRQSPPNSPEEQLGSIRADSASPSPEFFPAEEFIPLQNTETIENSPSGYLPFVEAYFEKFHPKWPFLHPATFTPDREPPFLLQSVIMMGLWVTGDSTWVQTAKDIHQKLTTTIYEQRANWDLSTSSHALIRSQTETAVEPIPWAMATYQGILLHLIFSLLISHDVLDIGLTHNLPTIPSRLLIALVHTCLKQKMFYYPAMLAQFNPETNPDVFVWLGIEEVKRFGLSLYRVCRQTRVPDANALDDPGFLDIRRGSRERDGLLSLGDLQFSLPDSDELWHLRSELSSRLTETSTSYSNQNVEENWISRIACVPQGHDTQFQWI